MRIAHEMTVVARKQIAVDPDRNARRTIYRKPIEELKASIVKLGLLQPVGVRAVGKDGYTLVWGYRRMTALDELKWDAIPVVIVDADEARAYDMMLAENVIRQDVAPWDLGASVVMLKRKGMTDEELTERLCLALDKSFTVDRLLRLGKTTVGLIPELVELWKRNTAEFGEDDAYRASQMSGDDQFDLLVKIVGNDAPSKPLHATPTEKKRSKTRPRHKSIERAYQSLKAHDADEHDDGIESDAERKAVKGVLQWVLGGRTKCPIKPRPRRKEPKT
jgi:ParB/RepB/Spo0J family partition protein